jgi:exodeoxyribonuclease VII large subunit
MKAISVTELNNQIKSVLEPYFEIVLVKGEVSKVTYHSSGHLYFTLKDENSAINCAMWRSNLAKMKFKLKEGD